MVMRMSETIIVKDFEGKEYKVEIGKITFGQRCKILNDVMKVKVSPTGQTQDMDLDYIKFERMTTQFAILKVEPAVESVMEFVDSLPVDEAKKIVSTALELNPF